MRELWARVRTLLFRRRLERELEAELAFHLDMKARALAEEEGLPPDEVRARAARALGPALTHRERALDVWRCAWLDTLGQDVRFGLRLLRRRPTFAFAAAGTIALGIGLVTSIFSIVSALMLRPLPLRDADRIVMPYSHRIGTDDRTSVPFADYLDWRRERGLFESVAVFAAWEADFSTGSQPERVAVTRVTDGFFAVLGARPVAGRLFAPAEFAPGTGLTVVISERLWNRLGRTTAVFERPVRVAGDAGTVVGVVAADAAWPLDGDVWTPLRIDPLEPDQQRRDNFIWSALARLAPGVTLDGARARLAAVATRIAAAEPVIRQGWTTSAAPLRDVLVQPATRTITWLLAGAVGLILLMACLNVAGLLVARGESRTGELALRAALGAGRWRLVRQMLVESACLAAAGGVAGLLLAAGGVRALAVLAPAGSLDATELRLDAPVLVCALAATTLSAVIVGLIPAISASRPAAREALQSAGLRSTEGRRDTRVRQAMVAAQVAAAVVLLVGAGLLARTLVALRTADPGIRTHDVLAVPIALAGPDYATPSASAGFYERLFERLRGRPGVMGAGAVSWLPAGGPGFQLGRVFLEEGQADPPHSQDRPAEWIVASPGYFDAVGIPLRRGRLFDARDAADANPVIILSESMARSAFPGRDPIGRRIRSWRDENVLREIVGVVGDARYRGLAHLPGPMVYVPHAQNAWGSMTLVVRAAGAPGELVRTVRAEVRALDPHLALGRAAVIEAYAQESIGGQRFAASLLGAFALTALLLAAVGLYGVMAYTMAARTREFGIRLALGATPGRILARVFAGGLALTALGITAGLAGTRAATAMLESLLYEISASDPGVLLAAPGVLLLVSAAAIWLPVRAALRADPIRALRLE